MIVKKFQFTCNKTFPGGSYFKIEVKFDYTSVGIPNILIDKTFEFEYIFYVEPNKKLNYCLCIPIPHNTKCPWTKAEFLYHGYNTKPLDKNDLPIKIYKSDTFNNCERKCQIVRMENFEFPNSKP